MDNEFDISTVDEKSKCFTKLKTLKLRGIEIDVRNILSKCCNRLEYLELNSLSGLELLEVELFNLEHLFIELFIEFEEESLRNLLSKCSGSLKTLNLSFIDINDMTLSTLLGQTMKITAFELESEYELEDGIDIFLNKCPLLQSLTLHEYHMEIKGVILNDLTTLELDQCGAKCINSILKQSAKHFLNTVELKLSSKVIMEYQFPLISTLDKILVHHCDQVKGIKNKPVLEKIIKLFPSDVQVI